MVKWQEPRALVTNRRQNGREPTMGATGAASEAVRDRTSQGNRAVQLQDLAEAVFHGSDVGRAAGRRSTCAWLWGFLLGASVRRVGRQADPMCFASRAVAQRERPRRGPLLAAKKKPLQIFASIGAFSLSMEHVRWCLG